MTERQIRHRKSSLVVFEWRFRSVAKTHHHWVRANWVLSPPFRLSNSLYERSRPQCWQWLLSVVVTLLLFLLALSIPSNDQLSVIFSPTKLGMAFPYTVNGSNFCVMNLPSSKRTLGISNELRKPFVKSILKRTLNLLGQCQFESIQRKFVHSTGR